MDYSNKEINNIERTKNNFKPVIPIIILIGLELQPSQFISNSRLVIWQNWRVWDWSDGRALKLKIICRIVTALSSAERLKREMFVRFVVKYKLIYWLKYAWIELGSSSSSRHHSVLRGFLSTEGLVNFKLQISFGTVVHSSLGFRLGTNWEGDNKKSVSKINEKSDSS